jgi:hypothetical protein
MYYFDNKYLQQYIDQNVDLWVYDGYEWFEVADRSDILDPIDGYGYDVNGRGFKFKYKQIEKIKVDGKIFTIDNLQSQFTGKPSQDVDKPPAGKNQDDTSEEPPEPESKKEPELSHFSVFDVGRELIREYRKKVHGINDNH